MVPNAWFKDEGRLLLLQLLHFLHWLPGVQSALHLTHRLWAPFTMVSSFPVYYFSSCIVSMLTSHPQSLSGITPGTETHINNHQHSLSENNELYSTHSFVSVCYTMVTLLGEGGRH